MICSDQALSEKIEKDQEKRILQVFDQLGTKPETTLNPEQLFLSIESIESELGTSLFGTKETSRLKQLIKSDPEFKSNFQELQDLLSKILHKGSHDSTLSSPRVKATSSLREPRTSALSDRLRGSPLPISSPSVPSVSFQRPASPSQLYFSRSLSAASGRNSPFLRRQTSISELDSKDQHNRLEANNVFNLTNSCVSPAGINYLEIFQEPSHDPSLNSEEYEDKLIETKLGQQKVRRANSQLNKKLDEAEDTLSKLSNETREEISQMKAELKAVKLELAHKKKTLSDSRSEVQAQTEQIESLEKDKKELHSELVNFKKLYFQSKSQLETVKNQKSLSSASSRTDLEELEEMAQKYHTSHRENQELSARCNSMVKAIANLEKDVAIAQSVAKNFDELVQENFQLKETIESLQKSLAKTYETQSNSGLDLSQGLRLNTELSGSSTSASAEITPAHLRNSSSIFPPRYDTATISRQLKGLENENRYLKRHTDKTWGQWDRVKGDLVDLVTSTCDQTSEVSKQKLGSILLRMERYRPAKAYPTFQRASIQQILIDDRPALSSTDGDFHVASMVDHAPSSDASNVDLINHETESVPFAPITFKLKDDISDLIPSKSSLDDSGRATEDSTANREREIPVHKFDVSTDSNEQQSEMILSSMKSTTSHNFSSNVSNLSKDDILPVSSELRSVTNSSSASQSDLSRRALKKTGPRVIKKLPFSQLYEKDDSTVPHDVVDSVASHSDIDSSPVLSSDSNPMPLPKSSISEDSLDISESLPQPPLENLFEIGEMPPPSILNRLNKAASRDYFTTNTISEKTSSKLSHPSPRTKESKPNVSLIALAAMACMLTYQTSAMEPIMLEAPSLKDEEERERDNILDNVTRHSYNSPSGGYKVRLDPGTSDGASHQDSLSEVDY